MGNILLNEINSPEDLKKLPPKKLENLAEEIREVLINTVANNGGHLASNLGVVELTIALHYVFQAPTDKIIWDVGHQSYVHKMLTGRQNDIGSIRCYGGLSGFPKREESPCDAFNTGHSSTSVSAAVGMALGRDLTQDSYSVVAVIGDGALTGGMSFEALNHASHVSTDLTIILNDNEMSISKNVGGMANYLNKLRSDPAYSQRKEEIEQALMRIPGIGANLVRAAGKIKDLVKFMVVPGMIFEELGLTYLGPIDGHNLEDMILILQKAKRMKGPVLIHVITQKGKGYVPALQEPDVFHGIGPFDVDTGIPLKGKSPTYTQVFGDYMAWKGAKEPRLVGITAAMNSGTGLGEFADLYPERFFDVGICEQHAVTMAAGMACSGLKPVVAIYSTFLQRAYDQVLHDICLQNLPVVFALDRAGLVGEDGPTHHGVFDLSYLRQIPNMTVMTPADESELPDMLDSALQYEGPVAVRYPRGAGTGKPVKESPEFIPVGKGELLINGDQVGLVGLGRGVDIALQVNRILREQGINPAVINARFIKPLDRELLINWGKRCRRMVTIEDNALSGGFGSAVLELFSQEGIDVEVLRIGIPDKFIEHGPVNRLFSDIGMDPDTVAERVRQHWPELQQSIAMEGFK
ncbi:MAG: 1-deoxy-D-xylulose-5-phosphate synthase [Chitinophagales bacterium]